MLAGQRLLIIEDEFLIALDMQRALEAAGAGAAVLAQTLEEAARLGEAISGFDLIVMPPPPLAEADRSWPILDRIASSGAAIVVCSGLRAAADGSRFPDAEFVDKPFADEDLVAACERALAKRQRIS